MSNTKKIYVDDVGDVREEATSSSPSSVADRAHHLRLHLLLDTCFAKKSYEEQDENQDSQAHQHQPELLLERDDGVLFMHLGKYLQQREHLILERQRGTKEEEALLLLNDDVKRFQKELRFWEGLLAAKKMFKEISARQQQRKALEVQEQQQKAAGIGFSKAAALWTSPNSTGEQLLGMSTLSMASLFPEEAVILEQAAAVRKLRAKQHNLRRQQKEKGDATSSVESSPLSPRSNGGGQVWPSTSSLSPTATCTDDSSVCGGSSTQQWSKEDAAKKEGAKQEKTLARLPPSLRQEVATALAFLTSRCNIVVGVKKQKKKANHPSHPFSPLYAESSVTQDTELLSTYYEGSEADGGFSFHHHHLQHTSPDRFLPGDKGTAEEDGDTNATDDSDTTRNDEENSGQRNSHNKGDAEEWVVVGGAAEGAVAYDDCVGVEAQHLEKEEERVDIPTYDNQPVGVDDKGDVDANLGNKLNKIDEGEDVLEENNREQKEIQAQQEPQDHQLLRERIGFDTTASRAFQRFLSDAVSNREEKISSDRKSLVTQQSMASNTGHTLNSTAMSSNTNCRTTLPAANSFSLQSSLQYSKVSHTSTSTATTAGAASPLNDVNSSPRPPRTTSSLAARTTKTPFVALEAPLSDPIEEAQEGLHSVGTLAFERGYHFYPQPQVVVDVADHHLLRKGGVEAEEATALTATDEENSMVIASSCSPVIISCVQFSHRCDRLAAGGSSGVVFVHPIQSPRSTTALPPPSLTLDGHQRRAISSIEWSEADDLLLTVSFNAFAILWDTTRGIKVRQFSTQHVPFAARFLPKNNNFIVVGSQSPSLRIFNLSTGMLMAKPAKTKRPIGALCAIDGNSCVAKDASAVTLVAAMKKETIIFAGDSMGDVTVFKVNFETSQIKKIVEKQVISSDGGLPRSTAIVSIALQLRRPEPLQAAMITVTTSTVADILLLVTSKSHESHILVFSPLTNQLVALQQVQTPVLVPSAAVHFAMKSTFCEREVSSCGSVGGAKNRALLLATRPVNFVHGSPPSPSLPPQDHQCNNNEENPPTASPPTVAEIRIMRANGRQCTTLATLQIPPNRKGEHTPNLAVEAAATDVVWSSDGKMLAVGTSDGRVVCWERVLELPSAPDSASIAAALRRDTTVNANAEKGTVLGPHGADDVGVCWSESCNDVFSSDSRISAAAVSE